MSAVQSRVVRRSSRLGILALFASVALVGCDDGNKTGSQAKPDTAQEVKANTNMSDFMATQKGATKAATAPAK